MEIVAETGPEETHRAIDTFFRNSDMLRLLASAKYLPDLRDVSRLASTNARTREVLSRGSDLVLCREICTEKKNESSHDPEEEEGAECNECDGEFTSLACRYQQAYICALYEKGNLRVARTCKAAMFKDENGPPLESDEIDYFELLGNDHFDVAIELAKTATNIPTLHDCVWFFTYIIWGLPGDTDEDTIRLADQRLSSVRAAFSHLGAGRRNIAMMHAMRNSADSCGISGPILSAIERNIDTLEQIFADADEDEDDDNYRSRRQIVEELVYSSFSSSAEDRDDIGKSGKRNGSGLGYLLRTARCNLNDLASIFWREIRGNWEGHKRERRQDKGFEYAERARRMLKAVYTETADLNLDWRGFFLSPDMTKALEWILQKTKFSPLIAEHMEQRDQTAHELLSTERMEDDSEEADKRERRFADAFIASLKLRRAPDRLLEFVATVIRDGLPRSAEEPPTKRHKQ